jgi:carboxyl-terminal processing protease
MMVRNCIPTVRILKPSALAAALLVLAGFAFAQSSEPDSAFAIAQGKSFAASPSKRPVTAPAQNPEPKSRVTTDFEEALLIIRRNHVIGGRIDFAEITKSSVEGMLHALDPHSNFFDSREYSDLLSEQQSEYDGIGTTIGGYSRSGQLDTYIASTYPGSPAWRAGLRFGDRIVAVNDEPVTGSSSLSVSEMIQGRSGSVLKLTVERFGIGRLETVQLRRARVPQPSITDFYMLRPTTGYIALTEGFTFTTADELNRALAALRRTGMRSLVLDLRGNTGGILEQAVRVAEKFLPEGSLIATQRGRTRYDNRVWKSSNKIPETMPLVVLVDGETASASEIVAGALQDHDRALIIGEKTFGKGLVQSVIDLPTGAGMALTTARYFTPSGRSIQRDYSLSEYDYYKRRAVAPDVDRVRPESETTGHRKVFGGDGITPDEVAKGQHFTLERLELLDPLFFFSLELAAGKVRNLERYSLASLRKTSVSAAGAFPTSGEIMPEFQSFVESEESWTRFANMLPKESVFITSQVRKYLATAAFGDTAATRIKIASDQQVAKALELLPKAGQLAYSFAAGPRAANNK